MKRIGILSDTHSFWDEGLFDFFASCDEIWHAGDIGSIELADRIATFKPFRAVYGNIDDIRVRRTYPEYQNFSIEGHNVLLIHIAGAPGKYISKVKELIKEKGITLLVCGHSHILRVKYDKSNNLMYINPGAAGNSGFHHVKTALRLVIDGNNISNLEVWEKKRG